MVEELGSEVLTIKELVDRTDELMAVQGVKNVWEAQHLPPSPAKNHLLTLLSLLHRQVLY
jgi:hypothetical protein